MKNTDFKKILFKGAFSVMACDGEVAESEIAEMKEMMSSVPHFDGLDQDAELKDAYAEIRTSGTAFIENFFRQLAESSLSEKQEIQLIEVLIRMIRADGKVADSELHFMHNVRSSLKQLSDVNIIVHFPRHFDLLMNLERFDQHELHRGLDQIDFGALGDLAVDS